MLMQGTLTEARPKVVMVGSKQVKVIEMKVVLPYARDTHGYLGEALGDPVEMELRSLQETLAFEASKGRAGS